MRSKGDFLCLFLLAVLRADFVNGQAENGTCYGSGSIAASVILTAICTVVLVFVLQHFWRKYKKEKELILETDPEKGHGAYAFDNPGFKESGLTPIGKLSEKLTKTSSESPTKVSPLAKWTSPLSALTLNKSDKQKTLDDSVIDAKQVKVVALRSHDFTGLGFNICGNMKDGIYIKDVLHHGPAFESGRLNSGDRITSVTIAFDHMVFEDAMTILSYASPYEVIIEARAGKLFHYGGGGRPSHPVFRSTSYTNLYNVENSSKKKLFRDDSPSLLNSPYSTLQKSQSSMTTLERKHSHSPRPTKNPPHPSPAHLDPPNPKTGKMAAEAQKSDKMQKLGVRVLPADALSLDEPDEPARPQARKREKHLERGGDAASIPQEVPAVLLLAAAAARSSRAKPRAPPPPDLDEILEAAAYASDDSDGGAGRLIELRAGDVTVHQAGERAASTGDLTRRARGAATLERARSLDPAQAEAEPPPRKWAALEGALDGAAEPARRARNEIWPRLGASVEETRSFLRAERLHAGEPLGNISDDIKVSLVGGLKAELHCVEVSVNEAGEAGRVTVTTTPDIIKNLTIAEAVRTANGEDGEPADGELTYVTEIRVPAPKAEPAEDDFERYVQNFETRCEPSEEQPPGVSRDQIREIAEGQLKTLPEMRFSINEPPPAGGGGEKRQSQIEALRSNFERRAAAKGEAKSRIPISTKTPPMSPERRDSRGLDAEQQGALLELMGRGGRGGGGRNVTVTSIRSSAKAPSGLPVLGGGGRVAKRGEGEPQGNGGVESTFKQWVFNPENGGGNSVTNIVVSNSNGREMK